MDTSNRFGTSNRLVGDTGLLLSVAAATAVRNVNLELESVDLRARTFSILELVAHADGMNQRRLADALRLNPSQIVALVDDLVAEGLVERRLDGADRRSRQVCVTEKGTLRLTEARALADRALDRTLRALDVTERATLHRLLSVLIASGNDIG
jgi:DNA-binding MarR family transcriptional regulator